MRTFLEFLGQYDRKYMPQVRKEHMAIVLADMERDGFPIRKEKVPAKKLEPMQHVDNSKVLQMVKEPEKMLIKPIMVDKDYKIVDGHHRWATAKYLEANVNVLRIMRKFEEIRQYLLKHSKVVTQGAGEFRKYND